MVLRVKEQKDGRGEVAGAVEENDKVEEMDKAVEKVGARRRLMQQEVVDLTRGENI